jgi:hypothetical protein
MSGSSLGNPSRVTTGRQQCYIETRPPEKAPMVKERWPRRDKARRDEVATR